MKITKEELSKLVAKQVINLETTYDELQKIIDADRVGTIDDQEYRLIEELSYSIRDLEGTISRLKRKIYQ